MAQLGIDYDPDAVEPGGNFEDLPVGEYAAQVVDSEVKLTKDGNGKLLVLSWQVTEGPCENRRIWQNLNIQNNSAAAQLIGQQQLKAVCEAVGFTGHLEDSEVLHNIVCRIVVKMGKGNAQYPAKPELKVVKPYSESSSPQTSRPAANAAPKQATTTATKPALGKAAGPARARPWKAGAAA